MKRYSRLNATLNYLKTDDEQPNPKAPSGTPLAKYQEWKSGERNVKYPRKTSSLPGEFINVALNPFGSENNEANLVIVPLSARAKNSSNTSGLIPAGNLVETIPDTAKVTKGFVPAKAVVFVPSGGAGGSEETSEITGKKYQKRGGESYTYPYGSSTSQLQESKVRSVLAAVVTQVTGSSISFTSEKL